MFTTDKEQVTDQVTPTETDSTVSPENQHGGYEDLLSTIVNEKGEPKYSDVPNALKGLTHAQAHIARLEAEKAALQEQMTKLGSVEEALEKLTAQKEPTATPAAGLDEQAASALFEKMLKEKAEKERVQKNQDMVVSTLTERFGDKAGDEFQAKAQSLGMTKEQLESLSAVSPKAVLAFFGTTATPRPTTGTVNTASFQPKVNVIPTIMDAGEERINLPAGEKSVLAWASNGDVMNEFKRHKEAVYAKYNITP